MSAEPLDLTPFRIAPDAQVDLDTTDTSGGHDLDKHDTKRRTAKLLERLTELHLQLVAQGTRRVLVVIQARDAGGKDGTIRTVFGPLAPQGLRVASFKVPTEPERAHDFLWRVHPHVPGDGELVVFNRSHYEDVLVVRVHDLVPEERWRRRYDHIRHFEQLLVDEGTTIVKLFLHVSAEEQRERLQDRIDDPAERWKFNSGDLAERKLWAHYDNAYEDMLERTSTDDAPWFVVPADRKWFRDLVVASILVRTLEGLDLDWPAGEAGIEGTVVE